MAKVTYRRKGLLGLIVPEWYGSICYGGAAAGIVAGATSWSLNLEPWTRQEAERANWEPWNLRACPQWCISPYKATLPKLTQTVPPTGDQIFKYLSLWGTFSSKPLRFIYCISYLYLAPSNLPTASFVYLRHILECCSLEMISSRSWVCSTSRREAWGILRDDSQMLVPVESE